MTPQIPDISSYTQGWTAANAMAKTQAIRLSAFLLALVLPLSACSADASAQRGRRPGDTQVVAQWSLTAQRNPIGFLAAIAVVNSCLDPERVIEKESGGLYFDDGNDIGSGTCNVYLYTDRVDETVARLISLALAGQLPKDLRVGVAIYKNAERADWTYRVAYPATLSRFDLSGN